MRPDPKPARVSTGDLAGLGVAGLARRPLRAFLSAAGVAIGVAAMVAVVGVASSGKADLDQRLAAIGTNLLRVAPGHTLFGESAHLPDTAVPMIGRIAPVTQVSAIGVLPGLHVYRTDLVPPELNSSVVVAAARPDLLATTGARISRGGWLTSATQRYPTVDLGSGAAQRMGVLDPGGPVWLDNHWYTVVGLLQPVPLAPELDSTALVGWSQASSRLGFDGYPTTIYVRISDEQIRAVQAVLAATADPQHPDQVDVSRPSDALAAKAVANGNIDALLLGLGAVALLVGAIGVANTMVVSVLERRSEIGLRRALGATRTNVAAQFVVESVILTTLGGLGGLALGIGLTQLYADRRGWPGVLPGWVSVAVLAVAVVVGAGAGLYPAWRAARLEPTQALASGGA